MLRFLRRLIGDGNHVHPWRAAQVAGALALLLIAALLLYAELFGPPVRSDTDSFEFLIEPEATLEDIARDLKDAGLVRYETGFHIAHALVEESTVRPGGYRLSQGMDAWTIAKILSQAPYLAWITVPPGYRKEQIAELLTETLSWTEAEKMEWLALGNGEGELPDGIYFPDTYLIPSDQTPSQVASRMRGRFEDVFAPYIEEAQESERSWTDIIIMASLVEKESAKNDKSLVAGILWNRIDRDMLLQVDATLQYIRGNSERWWPQPQSEDKYLESPYNTYAELGLPPGPIANPSIASIEAALRPVATKCLYYLHDSRGRIHCSTNYAGHVANINRYLR